MALVSLYHASLSSEIEFPLIFVIINISSLYWVHWTRNGMFARHVIHVIASFPFRDQKPFERVNFSSLVTFED